MPPSRNDSRSFFWGAHRETALTRHVSRVGHDNVAARGNATHCGASSRAVKDEEAGSGPIEFWVPGYSSQFIKLVDKFKNTIQIVFSGRTHMDDFRVIEAERTGLVVNKLVPSISPIFRNNPGFQVYDYDRESGAVRNYRTYYLSNLSTAGKPTGFEQVKWEREYDFSEAYQQPALNISAVVSIARALKTDAAIQALDAQFYSVTGRRDLIAALCPLIVVRSSIQRWRNSRSVSMPTISRRRREVVSEGFPERVGK